MTPCQGLLPIVGNAPAVEAWQSRLRAISNTLPPGTEWQPELWEATHNAVADHLPFVPHSYAAFYEWFAVQIALREGMETCPSCGDPLHR